MKKCRNHIIIVTVMLWEIIAVSVGWSATLTEVPRSTWDGGVQLPGYLKMYIYVPDKPATKPPIVVSNHACQSSVSGQLSANSKIKAAADKNGFIMIFPDNPGQNCWDVGSKQSLTHDGKGDTHGVAQMVRYALKKYNGDSSRVYVLGGSSGAMMTQALLGVYPELFTAGAARAGVPCGCWAESYASSNQWSGPCANGTVNKTPQQWGDYVRAINPNYKGHRPRVQLFQGANDATISPNNLTESIEQWTNVLELNTQPDSTATINSSGYTYNCKFWKNKCGYIVLEAWSAPGQGHSMNYEEEAILRFFGLDAVKDQDPELAACNGTGIVNVSKSGGRLFPCVNKRSLDLNITKAGETVIKIINTEGRMIYYKKHKSGSFSHSVSIPLYGFNPGYYVASIIAYLEGKPADIYNHPFVLTK